MPATKMYCVEHFVGPGEDDWVEYEYEVEVDTWEPYVPARISGPPEDCYPAEGGYVELCQDVIKRRRTDQKDAKWEEVPWSIFIEGMVQSHDLQDDPSDKWCGKTAFEKAEDILQEEMYQACEEEAEAAYEAAMEDKAEAMREMAWEDDY